jgi:HD-GYP domain-containing protein (c-di-GMP phosphodiesterase class II)
MDDAKLVHIRRGALLHDIGKLGVPDQILFKPGPLTAEEREMIERHVDFAYEMLAPIPYLKPALNIPYFHHEKWDGTGYPLGLKGEQIPLEARIFVLVDVWDALLSDRPYRKAWTREQTTEHIRARSGIHFDPRVVECFLETLNKFEENEAPQAT